MSIGGFPAKYAGTCDGCGTAFGVGTTVRYTDDDDLLALGCCGEIEGASGLFLSDGVGELSSGTSEQNILALTMPRGAKVKDRCLRCFQIPSSNGTCGCD